MELELKHLAPYLPYKLRFNGSLLGFVNGFYPYMDIKGSEAEQTSINTVLSEQWKPILRPLSDLTKEYINEFEVSFIEHIYSESWMAGGYDVLNVGYGHKIKSRADMSEIIISTLKPHTNTWWVTQELFKWHFDVFGLIESGLAIDINTL
jgi:hypothetical protein